MSSRVSPAEAIRGQINELFEANAGGNLLGVIEQVARLSVRLTFQSVIEEIVCEEPGRARYQRRPVTAGPDELPPAYRNGWQKPRPVKTALGPAGVQRPRLRHAHPALCGQLPGKEVTRTNALETLVISCRVRGLPDRDVEAMLAEVPGEDAKVGKATVSRICQRLRTGFGEWERRDLTGAKIGYLSLDASFVTMHKGAKAEPVLAAWGIGTDGKPVFPALAPGGAESADAWKDLAGRGLRSPLLVISDGGSGLCSAIERAYPASLHQRCLVHVCRNVIAKVPVAPRQT